MDIAASSVHNQQIERLRRDVKKMKNKIQITQNKCIRYCLQLDKMTHISKNEFETLNWLPVKDRFNQSINSIVFNCFCPSCLNEVFLISFSKQFKNKK